MLFRSFCASVGAGMIIGFSDLAINLVKRHNEKKRQQKILESHDQIIVVPFQENENTKIAFNYNSIQKIEGTDLVQTTQNDTNTIEIYSKDLSKITELKNGNIEKHTDYIKLYNNDEIKYVSKDGKEIKNIELFKDNKIFANKWGDKWGFVDKNGNKIVDYNYDKVTEVNKYGFAGIEKDGLWGVVDSNGKIIVEPQYKLNDIDPTFIGEYYQVTYGNGEIYYTK